jgi:hypothetical protein
MAVKPRIGDRKTQLLERKSTGSAKHVAMTGTAGQIAHSLLLRVA